MVFGALGRSGAVRYEEQHCRRGRLRDDDQLQDERVRRKRRRRERERGGQQGERQHQVAALLPEPEAVDQPVDHRDPAAERRERDALRRERGAAKALGTDSSRRSP